MPPHCDSLDGPVVTAARAALARGDVRLVLPFVKKDAEADVADAYRRAVGARNGDPAVNELAELYFFETVVRLHRAGEGAPYTGLKPAGLPVGPVIPLAERAVETGDAAEVERLLADTVVDEVRRRLGNVVARRSRAEESVELARDYVETMLGFVVWSHHAYQSLIRDAHEEAGVEAHGHGTA